MDHPFRWMAGPVRLMDYGHGAGQPASPNPQVYFLLVVDLGASELSADDVQTFYKMGTSTGRDFGFTLVDMRTDRRLADDLKRTENGRAILGEIEFNMPAALVVSDRPVAQYESAQTITIIRVQDFDSALSTIYERMGLPPQTVRRRAIGSLRKLNDYLHLKPNLLGVGFNLNQVISDVLDRLDRDMP